MYAVRFNACKRKGEVMGWNMDEKTGEDILNDIREAQKVIMESPPVVCTLEYCYKCRVSTIHRFGICQYHCLVREKK